MQENTSALYAAFVANDARFDGHFFVGVSSTGIYCRPICRARKPKAENCTFYHTAAAAEQAGYRPCLLCRPELSPGTSMLTATTELAYRAAKLLEENCGSGENLEELAARLGCSSRHLRRVFSAEYNVSPIQYLQTYRLLLAKNLLTATDLPVLEVAMAAGFGSLRRFNHLFQKHYQLSPTDLRRQAGERERTTSVSGLTLALGYRPPYPWNEMLRFLAGRAIPGVELVQDDTYMRTAHFVTTSGKPLYGWVQVGNRPRANALTVTVSHTLLPVLPQVLARVKHLFDLYCDPEPVYEQLQMMNEIRPGICVLGTRLPGCFFAFEMAVRAVLGQQITVKAASTLAARMAASYGKPLQTGIEGLNRSFPTPEDILTLEGAIENNLGSLGVIGSRSRTIYELARAITTGELNLNLGSHPETEIKKMMVIRGIGSWTAQYIAMRALAWPDAFLETDAGIKKALAPLKPQEMLAMAEVWRPWRSYATLNLWNTLA